MRESNEENMIKSEEEGSWKPFLCWKNRKWELARHSARKELPSQKEYIFLG